MAFETRLDSGALFVNDKKAKANHPDYNGKIVLSPATLKALQGQSEAVLYLSGWKKKSKQTGVGYLSLAASLPQSSKSMGTSKVPQPPAGFDEEIPF